MNKEYLRGGGKEVMARKRGVCYSAGKDHVPDGGNHGSGH